MMRLKNLALTGNPLRGSRKRIGKIATTKNTRRKVSNKEEQDYKRSWMPLKSPEIANLPSLIRWLQKSQKESEMRPEGKCLEFVQLVQSEVSSNFPLVRLPSTICQDCWKLRLEAISLDLICAMMIKTEGFCGKFLIKFMETRKNLKFLPPGSSKPGTMFAVLPIIK